MAKPPASTPDKGGVKDDDKHEPHHPSGRGEGAEGEHLAHSESKGRPPQSKR